MSRLDNVICHAEKQIKFQEGTHIPTDIYWMIFRSATNSQQICAAFSNQSLGHWLPKFLEEVWPQDQIS